MLQSVAVSCSMWQCVAVCCSVLKCAAVCCSAVQCVAVRCSVLQHLAVCSSVLNSVAVCCSVHRSRHVLLSSFLDFFFRSSFSFFPDMKRCISQHLNVSIHWSVLYVSNIYGVGTVRYDCLNYGSLLLNIVYFIGLFCKRDL